MKKKGQIWISAVLYILIISTAIILILKVGVPLIDKMKDKSSFSKAKETMLALDKTIQEVALEGEGSQRIIPLNIDNGKIIIANNEIVWEMKTKSDIMDSHTSLNYGDLKVTSNANVKTWETNSSYYMQTTIDDDIFRVKITKIGNKTDYASINTSSVIDEIFYDGNNVNNTFAFSVNGDSTSETGNGYTYMTPSGNNTNLGSAKVIAHINSSSFEYDIHFTLESYSDFLIIELKDVVI